MYPTCTDLGCRDGRAGRKMGHITVTAKTLIEAEEKILPLVDVVDRLRAERLVPKSTSKSKVESQSTKSATTTPAKNPTPLVGITMGSDSDKKVLDAGAALLRQFGIPYETNITSAHRTPERMLEYAKTAADRGLKVILACAGGSAHIAGMIASATDLPVIAIPVKSSHLGGVDSLLSMVQMPVSYTSPLFPSPILISITERSSSRLCRDQ